MLKPEARALLLAALANCLLLTACNDSAPGPTAKTPAAGGASKTPKASGVTALANAPVINEGLPLNVVIVPHQEFASVVVHFFSQDGLTLVSGDSLEPVTDAKPGKAIKHQLVLMPTREGIYMISASVETTGSDGTMSRVFSIPVVVAPREPAAPSAAASTTPPAPAAN